jgi:4-diphosphocytidyl-2-C-methyl-D-erythritol kinase
VVGHLNNGYHLLDSLVVFPEIFDKIVIKEAEVFSLSVEGEFADFIDIESNSIIKTMKLIQHQLNSEFSINLEKNIPVGAGLGGGTADAAAIIRYFSRNYKIKIPSMEKIVEIGADVPACISNRFQRVGGIGEVLKEISSNVSDIWIVLVNPRIQVSTESIFKNLERKINSPLEDFEVFTGKEALISYLLRQRSDLEAVACEKNPEIYEVIDKIKGTKNNLLSRMTGSGSTCFGLYLKKEDAKNAQSFLSENGKNWWVKYSRLF